MNKTVYVNNIEDFLSIKKCNDVSFLHVIFNEDIDLDFNIIKPIDLPNTKVHIDGNNHSLSSLKVISDLDCCGLFGKVKSLSISELSIYDLESYGKSFVGSLVGMCDNLSISDSYISTYSSGIDYVGGLNGFSESMDINNSTIHSNVNSKYRNGYLSSMCNHFNESNNQYDEGNKLTLYNKAK